MNPDFSPLKIKVEPNPLTYTNMLNLCVMIKNKSHQSDGCVCLRVSLSVFRFRLLAVFQPAKLINPLLSVID